MDKRLIKYHPTKRFLLFLIPLLLACGVIDNVVETPPSSEKNANVPAMVETATIEEPDESAIQPEEAAATSAVPNQAVEPNPLLIIPGIIEMENLMPESGVGIRPRLEWQEVEGALIYNIVVFEPDGTPYWAWRAEGTSVYVAGIDEPLPEGKEGPILADGMTWQVIAYDEDSTPIAVGGPWPISP
jgi:hypothetical protein